MSSSISPTAALTITGTFVVGDGRGAQLVVCSCAPFDAVVKIFDALYYSFEGKEIRHVPHNTAKVVDVEAAALEHLCNMHQTGLTAPE